MQLLTYLLISIAEDTLVDILGVTPVMVEEQYGGNDNCQ